MMPEHLTYAIYQHDADAELDRDRDYLIAKPLDLQPDYV